MSVARMMQMAAAGSAGAGPAPSGWTDPDLGNASYDSVSFSVAGEDAVPEGLFFKPDGTKMYVLGASGDDVNEYDLSAAWDISTASYSQNFSISGQETSPTDIAFNDDGSKMYIIGSSGDAVYEYDLSTAWDVSSASYVQNFSVAAQEASPTGLFFKPDGTKMYVTGTSGDDINEYGLSSAWDVSTASYVQNFSVSAQESNPEAIFFSPIGIKMYVLGKTGDAVYEYDLSTSWDVSTASYVRNFSISSQETTPSGLSFKDDGSKMYVIGQVADTIYQYSTAATPPAEWTDPDLANASYDSVSFSVAGQETAPQGLFFKPDGAKVYITGAAGDDVNEYDLSTAWDVSTASYLQNFSVSAQEASPQGLHFSEDGTKMYVLGFGGDNVNEYDLSNAWDVSSASYLQNFSVASQETTPVALRFKPDGAKMYVLGFGSSVYEYNLSTAWDVSTSSYIAAFAVSSQDGNSRGLFFSPNGDKFFMCGTASDDVFQYSLTTPWDISTASYDSVNFALATTFPVSLFFKSDGSKMYVSDQSGQAIYQYSTA